MATKTTFVAIWIAALLGGCQPERPASAAVTPPPPSQSSTSESGSAPISADFDRVYIVFADVTLSLTGEERAAVAEGVTRVVNTLPPRAKLYVFPLLEDVPRARALFEGVLPPIRRTVDRFRNDQVRTQWLQEIHAKLDAITNGSKLGRDHTCISGALRKAAEVLKGTTGAEVIVVSDMLEDCPDSLLGGPLSLEQRKIDDPLRRAHRLKDGPPILDLHRASVTALLTTVPFAPPTVKRPPLHDVEEFWRLVLDSCQDRRANFSFSTEMPSRLTALRDVEANR